MKSEYTPQQALELLIRKLAARDETLAIEVQAAVNEGKDVQQSEQFFGRGNKGQRLYRKTVPYSPEEALKVALDVLKAHFIEQPLFTNSSLDNIAKAALRVEIPQSFPSRAHYDKPIKIGGQGDAKQVEIELHTETQLLQGTGLAHPDPETLPTNRVSADEIKQQQTNIDRLGGLFDFS